MEELDLFSVLSLLLWLAEEVCVCSRREWRERTENNSSLLVLWSYILLCHQGKVRVGSAVDSYLNCLLATTLNISLLVLLCWRALGEYHKWKNKGLFACQTCDMREVTKYGDANEPFSGGRLHGLIIWGSLWEKWLKVNNDGISIAIGATLITLTSESIDKDFQSLLHLHRTITFLAALAVRIYIV